MLKETIYSPQSMPDGIGSYIKAIIKDFKLGHNLGKQLFERDLKAQYRQSFLGIFWAFAPAFVTALLWIFLNSSKVIKVEVTGMSFALFTTTGTLMWQIITQSLNTLMSSVKSGQSLLTKLNFPRESLLIHAFYTVVFNIAILLVITCLIALFMGWHPTWSILFFPLVLIDLMIVGFALGLLFHSIFSLIADFSKMVTMALPFIMYVSAVVFPKPTTGGISSFVFNINPFTHLIIFSRDIFTGLPLESVVPFTIISVISVALFFVGLVMYRITMPIIIERMGS
jgi:lipopolysaccharide transport system permease protein